MKTEKNLSCEGTLRRQQMVPTYPTRNDGLKPTPISINNS